MSVLWMEGFDQYGGDIDKMLNGAWAAFNSAAYRLSDTYARTGQYSMRVYPAGLTAARRVLPGNKDEVFCSCAVLLSALPGEADMVGPIILKTALNASVVSLVIGPSGQIIIRSGAIGGTILGQTTGPVIVATTWHHIEARFVRDASAGIVEVRVDGVEVLNLTGLNLGATDFAQWEVGNGPGTPAMFYYIDDMVIKDALGSYNNDFQGDLRVATLIPIANSASQGWTERPIQKLGEGVLSTVVGSNFNEGIAYNDNVSLEIGSGDFCIESFVRWEQSQTGTDIEQIMGKWREDDDTRSWRLVHKGPDDDSILTFQTCNLGTLADVVDVIEYPFVPKLKRWYHLAVSRDSGTLRMFINGVQVGVGTADSRTYYDGAAQVMINGQQGAGSNVILSDTALRGWFDATRITIGAARYTANFTPPSTSPTNDANTALLLNYEDLANTDESSNGFVGTLVNSAIPVFPDDILAYETVTGLTPNDNDLISADLVAATGTLTLTANPLDTEQVVIGSKTYTFQTTLTNVDGNVLIGVTASDSLDNLRAAVNLEAGAGTLYAAATVVNPDIGLSDLPGDQILATAKTPGAAGNSLATTTTVTGASWSASTLAGGADIPGYSEFDMSALPAEVTGLKAVTLVGRNYKVDNGSSEMKMSLKTAGGGVADGSARSVTTSPTYYEDVIEQDPNTAGALTVTTILGALFRVTRAS